MTWQPRNYRGHWVYDPRDEIRLRAQHARDENETHFTIPVVLALALADLRECGARTIITHDEDGKLPEPMEIQCRRPSGHERDQPHYNGYTSWPVEDQKNPRGWRKP